MISRELVAGAEEGSVNGIIRKFSQMVPPITSRIVRARSKSSTHVSSKYESLDYDHWVNELVIKEEQCETYRQVVEMGFVRWVLYFLVGVFTGFVAIFINVSVQFLQSLQFTYVTQYISNCASGKCAFMNLVVWYLAFGSFTLLGTALTVFIEPGAEGSGIPYIVSYLNGISIPYVTTLKVLIVKPVGVICACVGGLPTGKEGPLIHTGSIIGGIITDGALKIKIPWLTQKVSRLSNSRERRDLIAAGFAAGISAAFGSPVGATLLSLEEGTSFWSVVLMWRIFFCSIISTFTFNTGMKYYYIVTGNRSYSGFFHFGRFDDSELAFDLVEIPLFFIVGAIGGIVGAFYIFASSKIAFYRQRFINNRTLQLLDSAVFALVIATFAIVSIYSIQTCFIPKEDGSVNSIQLSCPDDQHNTMAPFWLNSRENILKLLYHSDIFTVENLIVFGIFNFILVLMINGIKIPFGVFIPALIIGAIWGRIFGLVLLQVFPQMAATTPIKYALLASATQLGGLVRTTLSLSVLIIEANGSIIFGFPIMFALFTTKWVGDFFTEGLYRMQVHGLNVPLLPTNPPPLVNDIEAKDLMNNKVVSFPSVASVQYILEVLGRVVHQGFPVVKEMAEIQSSTSFEFSTYGELRGYVLRSQLMTILHCKLFTKPETGEEAEKMLSLFRKYENTNIKIQNLNLSDEEKQYIIDLRPFMNRSPYSCQMVVGIISRKDLAKYRCWRHAASMGLKELRIR